MNREEIANLCHEQWTNWMNYIFEGGRSLHKQDGSVVIKPEFADRWKRQTMTEYKDLSEEEKESDRKEADKFIKAMTPCGFHDLEEFYSE